MAFAQHTLFFPPGIPIQDNDFLPLAFPLPVHRRLRVSSRLTLEGRCSTLHDPFGAGDSRDVRRNDDPKETLLQM